MRSALMQNVFAAGIALGAVSAGVLAATPTTAAPQQTIHYEYSQDEGYATLEQLSTDTEQVVYFRAEATRVEPLDDVPFTFTTVTVTQSLTSGVETGSVIDIRQVGDVTVEEYGLFTVPGEWRA